MKIHQKKFLGGGGGGGGRGGRGGMCTKNGSYCEREKKSGGGVRVDVNGEVKLL